MTKIEMTRWTVTVSKDTDAAVRAYLEKRGEDERDIAKFVEESVRWRVFEQTLAEAREKFADLEPDELAATIDEATSSVRAEMFPHARKTRS